MMPVIRSLFDPKKSITIIIKDKKKIKRFRLDTERLIIRDFKADDKEVLYQISNNPEVLKSFHHHKGSLPMEEVEEWISASIRDSGREPRRHYSLGIESKDLEKLIGHVGLGNVDYKYRKAFLGYFLHPDFWKNGYASEAVTGLIDYAFNVLNLRRIEAYSDFDNNKSQNFLKKLGFAEEGVLRENYQKYTGEVTDTKIFGLLRREWGGN